ncbi:MAG: hypothetical protein ACRD4E_13585, partial [Bryobacteraceae bacterium]
VEEFSKLNNSIYFHDGEGLYVNLFIPSELHWKEKGLRVRQENSFPDTPATTLVFTAAQPVRMPLRLRIPYWATSGASVKINGRTVEASASPGSYLTLTRVWKTGDRVDMELPMSLHIEKMPDEPAVQAVLYGPLVLAGDLGSGGLTPEMITGPEGPDIREHPISVPTFRAAAGGPDAWIKPAGKPLTFRTTGQERDVTFAPFDQTFGKRYSIYWNVT